MGFPVFYYSRPTAQGIVDDEKDDDENGSKLDGV